MIIAAGTIKDSRENIEKFVRRNLLGGVDHLVVFLDAPLPEVEEFLDAHPHVTAIRAHGDWWAGHAPHSLNDRQICNNGLVSRVIGGYDWAEWLFVLDGDEVVRADRGVLDQLPPGTRGARLAVLEAVSRLRPEHDPILFKRLLGPDELELLMTLGLISEPRNRAYLRGHVAGKPGVRPSPDLAVGVHHVVDTTTGQRLELAEDPRLSVLHYESPNEQEFARKWRAMLGSGIEVGMRADRRQLSHALRALLALDLGQSETDAWFEELFKRCALDDAETLSRLGLLVEIDPDIGVRTFEPETRAVDQLRTLLDRAHGMPKQRFRPQAADRTKTAQSIRQLQRGV